ncbi:hypothetical protein ACC807_14900 [Rhizobium ruizarguesonis]
MGVRALIKLKYSPTLKASNVRPKIIEPKSAHRIGNFRRYTNLAAAIHLLQSRKITLLNPASWDDKNDAHFMAEYKRLRAVESVLAICFAAAPETYHHWRVFSHGTDGVCISFDRRPLLSAFKKQSGMAMGKMSYERVDTVAGWSELKIAQLPFLKRKPYEPEKEFRVVYESKTEQREFFDVPIELGWINTITLSPWMPTALQSAVSNTLRAIKGCEGLTIVRSTLVGRASWQALASRAVD